MHNIHDRQFPRISPLLAGTLALCLLLGTAGCRTRKPKATDTTESSTSADSQTATQKSPDGTATGSSLSASPHAEVEAFEKARTKHREVTRSLEDASRMMKSGNLEGSLRLVQRVQQENREDPFVSMQTNYLQAMIFHRQNDPTKRKAAMNEMLKSLENAQKDPRFRRSYEEGMAGVETIRESLQRHSKKYAND